jgi:hypothetical protein
MHRAVDIAEILTRGGAPRIALLRYCVMAVTMEPVFVFLTQEYRLRPTHAAALALYDVFCAPDAPARIKARAALPPRNLALVAAIRGIRQQWDYLQGAGPLREDAGVSITTPYRNLFDPIARSVQSDAEGAFARLELSFDPELSPQENLPGGRMNAGQRHFVEKLWQPLVRPRLVAAGFWRIANIE